MRYADQPGEKHSLAATLTGIAVGSLIVDRTTDTIERYTEPSGDDYRHMEKVRRRETFESIALSGLTLRADAVFG